MGLTPGLTGSTAEIIGTYETPYLLWANEAYAPYCNFDALELPDVVSSNYLGAAVYELTGLTGLDPYFDTLEDLRRTLPVISHGCYLDADGTALTGLTEAEQSVLTRLADWKYYRLKEEPLLQ